MQEHLKDFTGDDISLEAKDQDELEFHYFKLHDYDNNNKLGESLCNSCNLGTSGLPDMYTRSPRVAGLRVDISGRPRVLELQLLGMGNTSTNISIPILGST